MATADLAADANMWARTDGFEQDRFIALTEPEIDRFSGFLGEVAHHRTCGLEEFGAVGEGVPQLEYFETQPELTAVVTTRHIPGAFKGLEQAQGGGTVDALEVGKFGDCDGIARMQDIEYFEST